MTEMETIERAKMYIDKLAEGINPLNDKPLPEDDIVNNVRIARCFFYVSDVLRRVIENGGIKTKVSRKKKIPFYISFDKIQSFPFSDRPIPVSNIADRINAMIDGDTMKKIAYRNITDWLVSVGILAEEIRSDGKTTKRPTEMGVELGITTEVRSGISGSYTAVLYDRNAQQFIVDNIESVIAMMNS